MPKMGESIVEATVISWQKKVGDHIDIEEIVVEVATDKVDSEIPSPIGGTLVEILIQENEVVAIGAPMARIETGESGIQVSSKESEKTIESSAPETPQSSKEPASSSSKISEPIVSKKTSIKIPQGIQHSEAGYFSPLVKNIARTEGITVDELNGISGTGGDGRVTKHDLINYIKRKRQGLHSQISSPLLEAQKVATPVSAPKITSNEEGSQVLKSAPSTSSLSSDGDEIIEMDRMRKVIANHMKHSQETSATVTSFVEADATHLVHWRNKHKTAYKDKYGESLTFTHLFVEAVIAAIGDHPSINAMIDGDNIILKRDINIGIATAMENGNLIVPVIKNAGALNLQGLTAKMNELTSRARVNKIKADEIQGGTFTISNIGTYGNIMGTPIINQPQLAILALGAIKKKPVIQETSHGDIIAIRHMMFLSLSFDHRVIDGYQGGVFLNRIAQNIEAFNPDRSI